MQKPVNESYQTRSINDWMYKQNMKLSTLIACLALAHLVCSVIVLQSSKASTTIVSPAGSSVIISSVYNAQKNDFAGVGVDWIQNSKQVAGKTVYQSLFYTNCVGPTYVLIAAYQSFTAYLDDKPIGSGAGYFNLLKFNISLSCGNHNFTVVVTSIKVSALTFSINQDQSACFKCQLNGFWSQTTCSCQCLTPKNFCECIKPKIWKDYPYCSCGCPKKIIQIPNLIAKAEDDDNEDGGNSRIKGFGGACVAPQYYSEATCGCLCKYQWCPPKWQYNTQKCMCQQIIT